VLLRMLLVLLRKEVEQGQELALDHIVVADVPAALLRKHEVVGFFAFGAQFPFFEHQNERLGERNAPHSRSRLGHIFLAIGIDPRLDLHLTFRQIEMAPAQRMQPAGANASRAGNRKLHAKILVGDREQGAVTRYSYDAQGDVASVMDAVGHVTSFTSYDGAGRLLRSVDPNGLVTTFVYDARERLLRRTEGTEQTSFTYDPAGNLTDMQKPDSSFISNVYDAAHRLTGMLDALGNSMSFVLDGNDNRVQAGTFDPANNLAQKRAFAYDSVNRLAQEIGAAGQTTGYSYDPQGNLIGVRDPLNHQTAFAYDGLNRRVQTTDAEGGLTRFGYDALDRLTAEADPRGLTTGYFYDGLDDETGIASPDTGNTVKTYDAAGNMLTSTDARGKTTTYEMAACQSVSGLLPQVSILTIYIQRDCEGLKFFAKDSSAAQQKTAKRCGLFC
jgi:YD repeat-containing protein